MKADTTKGAGNKNIPAKKAVETEKAPTQAERLAELADALEAMCLYCLPLPWKHPVFRRPGDGVQYSAQRIKIRLYREAWERLKQAIEDVEIDKYKIRSDVSKAFAGFPEPDRTLTETTTFADARHTVHLEHYPEWPGANIAGVNAAAADAHLRELADGLRVYAESATGEILPGWRHNKLVLKQVPNGKTPAVFAFRNKKYTVPSGNAWDTVCALIHADAFDGHGLKMKTPSDYFKREHRAFFSERMTKNGSGWYIKTQ